MKHTLIIIPLFIAYLLPHCIRADSYPFELPEQVTASIEIDTTSQQRFNNKLLATNIFGFTSTEEQSLINTFSPSTIRFPHGLWANWYDWRKDHTRQYGGDKVTFTNSDGNTITRQLDHLSSIQIFERLEQKIGIDGLMQLNQTRQNELGQGYDMVWTFNMSADGEHDDSTDNDSPETIARYQDLLQRGFSVRDIELGNENFYPGQRSTIIPGVGDYIARAKTMSKDLKALNPNLKLSVPMLRKPNSANPNYNQLVAADDSYFDAVTVHTYVGYDPDNNDDSDEAFGTALVARAHIANSVNDYSKQVVPDKPVWLTEWGVKSGGANAASVIGMADVYLFMSENQHIYHRANWFSLNGQLNSFLLWETYIAPSGVERPRIKTPLEKTLFGSTHEVLSKALLDSVLLASSMTSPELDFGVQAVSGRAILKNEKTQILVLNKTNQQVPFNIQIDGIIYEGSYLHKALTFDSLSEERLLDIDADPLTSLEQSSGELSLPKYSINLITLEDTIIAEQVMEVEVDTDSRQYIYQQNEDITFVAYVKGLTNNIKSVTFSIDGHDPITIAQPPFQTSWQASSSGPQTITAKVTDNSLRTFSSEPLYVSVQASDPIQQEVTATLSSDKTTLTLGQSVTLTLDSAADIGTVERLELYIDETLTAIFSNASNIYVWTPSEAKTSTLYLKATGDQAASAKSTLLSIKVTTSEQTQPEQDTGEQSSSDKSTANDTNDSSSSSASSNNFGFLLLILLITVIKRKIKTNLALRKL